MSEDAMLTKKITVRVPLAVLEKISMFSAKSINQYVRDAIIEKIQREAISQNELVAQIARVAIAIEKLGNVTTSININNDTLPMQTAFPLQETRSVTNSNGKTIDDAEHERLFHEMIAKSAADILNNGWGNR